MKIFSFTAKIYSIIELDAIIKWLLKNIFSKNLKESQLWQKKKEKALEAD